MKPLYEIANEYQEIANSIGECDEISVEQIAMLDMVSEDIKHKSINIGSLIRNLEVESNSIKEAIDKMESRKISVDKKIEHLKEYLKVNLERCELKEVKSPLFDIKIKINPAAVFVKDMNAIPDKYFKEIIDRRLDKFLVAQELKNEIMIPGVSLERRTRVDIR